VLLTISLFINVVVFVVNVAISPTTSFLSIKIFLILVVITTTSINIGCVSLLGYNKWKERRSDEKWKKKIED
jgi:hypothetical protein